MKKKNCFNKLENQIKNSQKPYFVWKKFGHKTVQCYLRKGQKSKKEGQDDVQTHLTEGAEVIVPVAIETNLVINKTNQVLDMGTSRHLYANKKLFHDFEEFTNGECVYMDNSTIIGVMVEGKFLFKLTFEKINVEHCFVYSLSPNWNTSL